MIDYLEITAFFTEFVQDIIGYAVSRSESYCHIEPRKIQHRDLGASSNY